MVGRVVASSFGRMRSVTIVGMCPSFSCCSVLHAKEKCMCRAWATPGYDSHTPARSLPGTLSGTPWA